LSVLWVYRITEADAKSGSTETEAPAKPAWVEDGEEDSWNKDLELLVLKEQVGDRRISATDSKELEEHARRGRIPKCKDCPVCQIAGGPKVEHRSHEHKTADVLHGDLAGPVQSVDGIEGETATYGVAAVLRTQTADKRKTVMLPYVRTTTTKNQMDSAEAIRSIVLEIRALRLDGTESLSQ
jgi:hypothetical protein